MSKTKKILCWCSALYFSIVAVQNLTNKEYLFAIICSVVVLGSIYALFNKNVSKIVPDISKHGSDISADHTIVTNVTERQAEIVDASARPVFEKTEHVEMRDSICASDSGHNESIESNESDKICQQMRAITAAYERYCESAGDSVSGQIVEYYFNEKLRFQADLEEIKEFKRMSPGVYSKYRVLKEELAELLTEKAKKCFSANSTELESYGQAILKEERRLKTEIEKLKVLNN